MGLGRFELPTSRLSGVRSNRLSYRPFLEVIRRQHRSLPDRLLEINSGNNDLRVLTWDVSLFAADKATHLNLLLRKEVIQPQVPLRLPCYDFTPITNHTVGVCLIYK